MKKYVDGVLVDLTAEEITEYNTRLANIPSDFDVAIKELRFKRDNLLTKCDWTQSPDSPLTDSKKTEWATYRTNLRNLTNGLTTVEQVNGVTWPTQPS